MSKIQSSNSAEDEDTPTLRKLFQTAETLQQTFASTPSSTSPTAQTTLTRAISYYRRSTDLCEQLALFSPNETLDDISSSDLQYLQIPFHLAELTLRVTTTPSEDSLEHRKAQIQESRQQYTNYLKRLDNYSILSPSESKTLDRYLDNPDNFSTASTSDASKRRESKIAKFKDEKALQQKLEHIRQNPTALQNEDSALRNLHLTDLKLSAHRAFDALESIAQELQILSSRPPAPTSQEQERQKQPNGRASDARSQSHKAADGYSERLDPSLSSLLSNGRAGPILDGKGKPMRPFTLLDTRQRMQAGVFQPDHNLPTMTIDEYLEEEKRRGGIIEGGGAQSAVKEVVDEDDLERADQETMKARRWDEFVEENPRGAGNSMNMG
ncbi:MAG: hypothetical protein M1831_001718 [Alyxoria varia]|nr:MAG: hypothetical protein M1831_001718 [Alyxoria varia]